MITEVGGTVGDIEILPFLEAIRPVPEGGRPGQRLLRARHPGPLHRPSGEQKTKPTQHSVTELRSRGIQPDVIVCRRSMSRSATAQAQDLQPVRRRGAGIVERRRRRNIYELPLVLHDEGLDDVVCDRCCGWAADRPLAPWEAW